jgi:hypothetical protein
MKRSYSDRKITKTLEKRLRELTYQLEELSRVNKCFHKVYEFLNCLLSFDGDVESRSEMIKVRNVSNLFLKDSKCMNF